MSVAYNDSPALRVARLVPDHLRVFQVPLSDARRAFGIPDDSLRAHMLSGLPSWTSKYGVTYVDRYDLTNIGLYLQSSRVGRVMHLWARSITQNFEHPREITLRLRSVGAISGGGEVQFFDPLRGTSVGHTRNGFWEYTLTAYGGEYRPQARWSGSLFEVPRIDLSFVRFPSSLRNQWERLREARVADCYSSARATLEVGRERGYDVRLSYGVLTAGPIAIPHHWAEWRLEDAWVSVEPMMVQYMVDMGFLKPAWKDVSGFGPSLVRLGDSSESVVVNDRGEKFPFVAQVVRSD